MDPNQFGALPNLSVECLLQDLPLPTPAVLQQAMQYQALPPLSTGKECLVLRGLPDDAQQDTIIEFLGQDARSVIDQSVHILYNTEGRPSGEAIIQMNSEEAAFWAVVHSHDRYMTGPSQKPSRIDALLCTVDEMKAKLASSTLGSFPPSRAGEPQQQEVDDANKPDQPPVLMLQPAAMAAASPSSVPPTFVPPGMPCPTDTSSPHKVTMLLLRNLPESTTLHDIKALLNGLTGIKMYRVYMVQHADGRFKDRAFVAVLSNAAAVRAILDRQCHIGSHKIDISIVDNDSVALDWSRP